MKACFVIVKTDRSVDRLQHCFILIFTSSYQLCISSYYNILQVPLQPPDQAWPRHGPPPVQWQHRRPHGLLHRPGWVHCRLYQWQKYSWKQELKLKIPQLKIFPCVAFLANPPVDKYLYILNVKYIFYLPLTDCLSPDARTREMTWNVKFWKMNMSNEFHSRKQNCFLP